MVENCAKKHIKSGVDHLSRFSLSFRSKVFFGRIPQLSCDNEVPAVTKGDPKCDLRSNLPEGQHLCDLRSPNSTFGRHKVFDPCWLPSVTDVASRLHRRCFWYLGFKRWAEATTARPKMPKAPVRPNLRKHSLCLCRLSDFKVIEDGPVAKQLHFDLS
jgi:hypothetical protein